MQNVVERILNLLIYLLESPHPVTAEDVRQTVHGYDDQNDDAFHRMFERDKDVLRRIGVPIKLEAMDAWEIDHGYTVDPDEYAIPDPNLTQEERVALSVAAHMVRLGGEAAGVDAIIKLGGIEQGAGVEPLGADLGEEAETLGVLFGAVTERRQVTFRYRDQQRPVNPYGLAHRRGHWYLVGETPSGERMYRVDRIEKLAIGDSPDAFDKPKNFDMRATLSSQPWEAGPDPETIVTMRFEADVAWWAARSLGLDEPRGDLTAEIAVVNVDAFIGWVLSFGAGAEVVGPPEMRAAIKNRVSEVVGAVI